MDLIEELVDENLDFSVLNRSSSILAEREMLDYLESAMNDMNKSEKIVPLPANDPTVEASNDNVINHDFSDIYDFLVNPNATLPRITANDNSLDEAADYLEELRHIEEIINNQENPMKFALCADYNQNVDPLSFLNSDDLVLSPFKRNDTEETGSLEDFIAQDDLIDAGLTFDWSQFVNFSYEEIEAPSSATETKEAVSGNEKTDITHMKANQNEENSDCFTKNLIKLRAEIERNFKVSEFNKEVAEEMSRVDDGQMKYCRKLIVDPEASIDDMGASTGKYSIFLMPFETDGNETDSKTGLNQFVQKMQKNSNALKSMVQGIVQSSNKRFVVPFAPKQSNLESKPVKTLQEQLAQIDKENIRIPMINYNKMSKAPRMRKQLFDMAGHYQLRDYTKNDVATEKKTPLKRSVKEPIVLIDLTDESNVVVKASVAFESTENEIKGRNGVTSIAASDRNNKTPTKRRATTYHQATVSEAKKRRLSLVNADEIPGQRTSLRIREKLRHQNE